MKTVSPGVKKRFFSIIYVTFDQAVDPGYKNTSQFLGCFGLFFLVQTIYYYKSPAVCLNIFVIVNVQTLINIINLCSNIWQINSPIIGFFPLMGY